jgi:hypothetical protein
MAPSPSPPLPTKVRVCPYVTLVVPSVSAADWFALLMVIVEVAEAEAYWVSAAFVAVTSHEPAAVGVNASPSNVQSPDTFI